MSVGAVLVGLALLIITIPIVAGPVVNQKRNGKREAKEREEPTADNRYQQILRQVSDLDLDRQLGVVNREDYESLRTQLLAEAARAREDATIVLEDALDARIEAAAHALRRQAIAKPSKDSNFDCYQCGSKLEASDRFCSLCGSRAVPRCSGCGRRANLADRFCAECGKRLPAEVVV